MEPVEFEGATHDLRPPPDFKGPCAKLAVRVTEDENGIPICESHWMPTLAEKQLLFRGGHIVLAIAGAQPPVALSVVEV